MCRHSLYAIFCSASIGPTFGWSDNSIMSGSNSNQESSSHLGITYTHAAYQFETDKAELILAGSLTFKTLEIEVFVTTN